MRCTVPCALDGRRVLVLTLDFLHIIRPQPPRSNQPTPRASSRDLLQASGLVGTLTCPKPKARASARQVAFPAWFPVRSSLPVPLATHGSPLPSRRPLWRRRQHTEEARLVSLQREERRAVRCADDAALRDGRVLDRRLVKGEPLQGLFARLGARTAARSVARELEARELVDSEALGRPADEGDL